MGPIVHRWTELSSVSCTHWTEALNEAFMVTVYGRNGPPTVSLIQRILFLGLEDVFIRVI